MEPTRAAQALAHASASMIKPHDVMGALVGLLDDCKFGLGVDAGGVLIEADGSLELLVASSHQASELETHQLHVDEGPCIEAYQTSRSVQSHSADALAERWPNFAKTMLAAGFHSVHAAPIAVQGTTYGAMGLFRRADVPFSPDEDRVAQAFADIASILVVHLGATTPELLTDRVQRALGARITIERAKGVLADARNLSMADAYDVLVQGAEERQLSLTAWAARVIDDARTAP